ncbi:hypothetical protein DPF_1451 [Desulfoplanes formicivorans]|uniref:Uncharacterized protein n=1 Tax=Desulfoplanes formicivorans TaxID=1592317 RepID=A0A194AHP3_9BACT|nr:hypothetical protein DPF_1451 [Desulfoplanes formicivorans]
MQESGLPLGSMGKVSEECEDRADVWSMGVLAGMPGIVDAPRSCAAGVAAVSCEVVIVTFHCLGDGADKKHKTSLVISG